MTLLRTFAYFSLLSLLASPLLAFIDAESLSDQIEEIEQQYGGDTGLGGLIDELEEAAGGTAAQFLQYTHPTKGAITFWDVPKADWYYAPVLALVELGVVTGKEDTRGSITGFAPAESVSVGAALKMTLLAAGVDPATCTGTSASPNHWAAAYERCANERGFGLEGSLDDPATRAEMARFTLLAFGVSPGSGQSPFPDVPASHKDKDYIAYAYAVGIVTGDKKDGVETGTYRPDDSLNRAEGAAIIQRALENL
jgi:hypothetical protein